MAGARPLLPSIAACAALLWLLRSLDVSTGPFVLGSRQLLHSTGGTSRGAQSQRVGRVSLRASLGKAVAGSRVAFDYVGTFEDGTQFDTSENRQPLEFVCGEGEVMSKLEDGIMGMAIGETRDVKFGADSPMFGFHEDAKILEVPLEQLPPGIEVGTQLTAEEDMPPVLVVAVGEVSATVDMNHPWAGRAGTMTMTLLSAEEVLASEKVIVETLVPGDGETYPEAGDELTMHYTGTLAASGAQFDSSRDRGEPFTFQIGVGQVIPGWDKGVMKMSLGERAVLRIPAAMGYGARGAGKDIPPNSDLVFDVELLKIG